MSISEQDWQAAVDAIAEAEVAVISCHIHPDGDALGSALAEQNGERGVDEGVFEFGLAAMLVGLAADRR